MIASFMCAAALAAAGQAAPVAQPAIATMAASTPVPQAASETLTIPQDTPVELMATIEISTADVKPGTRFKLRLNQPVEVDGRLIVPVGASAVGEVLTAKDSGGLGKSGKMTARLLFLQLGDVQIPLEGEVVEKGRGAGSAGSAILLGGLVGLFHRGNNAKIKAGEIVMGFVSQDVVLDVSRPTAKLVSVSSKRSAPLGGNFAVPAAENK
jgi:hypothetical protein